MLKNFLNIPSILSPLWNADSQEQQREFFTCALKRAIDFVLAAFECISYERCVAPDVPFQGRLSLVTFLDEQESNDSCLEQAQTLKGL